MGLCYIMLWILFVAKGETVIMNSCQPISCKNITTSSGQTIQLIPKRVFQMNGYHDNLKHFGSSTSHLICKTPSCLISPCKNEGVCLETDSAYECSCPNWALGDHCEEFLRTCAELKARNSTANGTYLIDPDGSTGNLSGPITVRCRDGITIIPHNIPGERSVPQGFEPIGSYRQNVEYTLPMDTIIAIMNNSRSCRQYVKASCYDTYIYKPGDRNIYWVSRQGITMPNWGDVPSDVNGCLCGINNTCFNKESLCNCDNTPNQWLSDDGYLTDSTRLPVIRMHFGDTGSSHEKTNYELGFLECE